MPVYTPPAWPAAVADTPATAVIDRAIAEDRLSHSLLLHCEDLATLGAVAHAIAERLLNTPDARAHFPPDQHPDCFTLRPAGKMRQISAEATRQLIAKVQVSSTVSPRKVAIIHEADRMHVTAANVFLKTLEEPPPHTTLLLLTTRPYALIPTIRSRVLLFRFAAPAEPVQAEGWSAWLDDYHALLGRLVTSAPDRRAAADFVFSCYGLVARFGTILDQATAGAWEHQKSSLPADIGDDEKVAIETGLANGIRTRLFAEIERTTRAFALPRLCAGDGTTRRALTDAVDRLEHTVGLLRLNLNESVALEDFLLATLRFWSRR